MIYYTWNLLMILIVVWIAKAWSMGLLWYVANENKWIITKVLGNSDTDSKRESGVWMIMRMKGALIVNLNDSLIAWFFIYLTLQGWFSQSSLSAEFILTIVIKIYTFLIAKFNYILHKEIHLLLFSAKDLNCSFSSFSLTSPAWFFFHAQRQPRTMLFIRFLVLMYRRYSCLLVCFHFKLRA